MKEVLILTLMFAFMVTLLATSVYLVMVLKVGVFFVPGVKFVAGYLLALAMSILMGFLVAP